MLRFLLAGAVRAAVVGSLAIVRRILALEGLIDS